MGGRNSVLLGNLSRVELCVLIRGDSREEAIEHLKEAISLMLEPLPEHLFAAK
jgi:hypothetical protein